MFTLTHGFGAALAGEFIWPRIEGSRRRPNEPWLVTLSLFAGGVAPDLDIVAMATRTYFDASRPWISHRGITHSILGAGVWSAPIAVFVGWTIWSLVSRIRKARPAHGFGPYVPLVFLLGFAGGLFHILTDWVTPSGPWGGLPIFFPLRVDGAWHRVPGLARMGWTDPWIDLVFLLAFVGVVTLRALARKASRSPGLLPQAIATFAFALMTVHLTRYSFIDREQWRAHVQVDLPAPLSAAFDQMQTRIWGLVRRWGS